jgi:hypothetical protein
MNAALVAMSGVFACSRIESQHNDTHLVKVRGQV